MCVVRLDEEAGEEEEEEEEEERYNLIKYVEPRLEVVILWWQG